MVPMVRGSRIMMENELNNRSYLFNWDLSQMSHWWDNIGKKNRVKTIHSEIYKSFGTKKLPQYFYVAGVFQND